MASRYDLITAKRGAAEVPRMLDTLASALPIERITHMETGTTAAHIQGTVVMENNPNSSVVDRHPVQKSAGSWSGASPTASPAYPTLTVSALALWAADHLLGNGG